MAIIIDSRERLTDPIKKSLEKVGLDYTVETLEVGDYWLYCDSGQSICIEHKRAPDLLHSIKDDHLRAQCAAMLAQFEHCRLVISGKWMQAGPYVMAPLGRRENIFATADVRRVVGYLSSLQEAGVVIDWWPVWEDIGAYLATIKKRYDEEEGDHVIRPRRFTFTRKPSLVDAIERLQIPGVGGGRAEKVAQAFPDLRSLVQADLEALQSVLGKVTGAKAHAFFGSGAA